MDPDQSIVVTVVDTRTGYEGIEFLPFPLLCLCRKFLVL
jgi:hypothetical protein